MAVLNNICLYQVSRQLRDPKNELGLRALLNINLNTKKFVSGTKIQTVYVCCSLKRVFIYNLIYRGHQWSEKDFQYMLFWWYRYTICWKSWILWKIFSKTKRLSHGKQNTTFRNQRRTCGRPALLLKIYCCKSQFKSEFCVYIEWELGRGIPFSNAVCYF